MKKITLLLAITTMIMGLNVNAQITSFPYAEDFETGDGGWIADNATNGSWALGSPTGTIINAAESGANAWVTNLAGDYNTNEASTVSSPIFDFTSLASPAIQFAVWWNSEFSWDGLVLQSSIDNGITWQNVGAFGDPNNWYTDDSINGNPGGQQEGWSGRNSSNNGSGAWIVTSHALNGLAGETSVQLRFAFGSDGSVQDEGVAFDTVSVFEVTCPEPSNTAFVSSTATTANISWTLGATETAWEIVVQPQGTGLPTGAGTPTTTNNPHIEMGLTPATSYEAFVRANCGGDFSIWIGPINFATECTTFIAPYTEGFENGGTIPLCWTMNGGEDWNFDNTPPAFGHVGNNATITGATLTSNYFAWVDASGDDGPTTLTSPLVDVSSLTTPALSFFEISNNEGNANSTLDVEVWDGAAWNPVGTYNTNTVGWELKTIDISTLTITGDVQARFIFSETITVDFYDDIAIDDVTFDELPACVIPGGITANNITGTSANITWMEGGGETAWEYVIQLAGTGAPTGAGTPSTTTGFSEINLNFETDYEVYVRSNCGVNGFSEWVGPLNFTTTVQLDFTVDCTVGPENFTYCYENNDTNIFTFTSTDGTPLNFIINSGNVENNFDELVVFDTDGTTDLNVATPYGNNGDVSGITYQSTGDTISFQVTPDGSVDCQGSANINPLDITVSCATCINPIATYQVIDDCANGDQFLIDVNITSLGDAMSLAIQDNQGNTAVSISETGITQFGPYPFNTDIIFTVSNEQDVNCVITSSALQLAACPPENDNCDNATVAVVNDSFLCEMSTSGTLLEGTPSGVANPSCGGDPDDDVWFQFVATSEFQLIALANLQGSLTTQIDHAVYEGLCGALTEISCTSGFTLLSSVTPQLTIGDTYYIRIFSNNSNAETTTFDLCITPYEAPTNITCDATENLCPGGDDLYTYNTIGVIPGLGQIDCLFTSPNPTFSIIEIGTSGDINIEMVQNTAFDTMGNPIGDELDVDFALWGPFNAGDDYCDGGDYPTTPITACSYSAAAVENFVISGAISGDIYIVLITNFERDPGIIQINQTNLDPDNPDPNAGTLSAEITVDLISNDAVFIDDDNDETTPSVANLCGFSSITLDADSPFADTYEWSINGFFDPSLTGSSITVTESNFYTVTAYDTQCMGNDTKTVLVNLYKEAIVNSVPQDQVSITTCDDESGDGIEDFNLNELSSIILNDPSQNAADFLVTYHATLSDAQTGTSALTSPYSAADGTIIYVRVEDVNAIGSGSGCASTNTSFVLTVLGALPEITGVDDLELCDDNNDGIEAFDLELNTPAVLNGQDPTVFEVSYHISQTDAGTGMDPLLSPYNNISNPQTIYVRIQNTSASDCFKTSSFNLILAPKPVLVQAGNIPSCDNDEDGISNYDLTFNEEVIVNNQAGFTFTYHTNLADAETSMNAITNPLDFDGGAQTIYVRVQDIDGCFNVTTFDLVFSTLPVTSFNMNVTNQVCPNATVPITITATADNYTESEVTIQWLYEDVLIAGQTDLTLETVLLAGDYEIAVMYNDTGCTASEFVTVYELESCIIPQGISPNGDGKNDTFDLSSFDVQSLTIFNRYGVKIYEKSNYLDEWHGQSLDGDELPVGTYYYVMNYQGTKTKAAWVYINRENN